MGSNSGESLKAAFAALLRGDTDERDRLCARAEMQHNAEAKSRAIAKVLATDFYVNARGTAYPSRAVFEAGN